MNHYSVKPVKTEVRFPIKVILASMDERSVSRMGTIFKIIFKGRCKFAKDDGDAHLGIVDLDGDADAWKKYHDHHPGLPAIVMSKTPVKIEGTIYVAKPAKLDLLWESIFDLVTGSPSESGPKKITASDNNSGTDTKKYSDISGVNAAARALDTPLRVSNYAQQTGPREESELYYNPDNYLLGRILSELKESIGQQCIIHVQCWRNRRLILLPDQDRAYTDLTDSQLKNLGMATLGEEFTIEISRVCTAGKKEELSVSQTNGLRAMSINYLLWDLALRTARGRVPVGTDLSASFYLQAWPNFPRLPHTLHGMCIAALWVGNPRTLDNISRSLDIDQADVHSFYSAAVTTGLIDPTIRQIGSLIAPKEVVKEKSRIRGLLTSILRHISQ